MKKIELESMWKFNQTRVSTILPFRNESRSCKVYWILLLSFDTTVHNGVMNLLEFHKNYHVSLASWSLDIFKFIIMTILKVYRAKFFK